MTGYTPEALRQINELRGHYEQRERIEAIRALDTALYEAELRAIMTAAVRGRLDRVR